MAMSGSDPPPPPDPTATANAQAAANKSSAIATQELNATNQVTPYGNLTYNQSGTWSDGTPQLTATTTLSPEQQALYDLDTATQKNLGQIGVDQSAKVAGILNTPFDLNSAINDQQSTIAHQLLDPQWDRQQQQLETQLYNSGARPGSEAYDNAMRQFSLQRQDAYNSADLATRSQAEQEALTQRNQPLNEISALLSSSQVQQPSFTNTPTATIAAPNIEGDTYNSANLAEQNYATNIAQQNAMMGGAFGLAGAGLGGWGAFNGFNGLLPKRA